MQTTPFYRPTQVMGMLDISTTTLRRWCLTFPEVLSETAKAHPRRFDAGDVAVLRRIHALYAAGLRTDEVHDRIRAEVDALRAAPPPQDAATEPPPVTDELPEAEPASTALQPVAALLDTLSAQQKTLDRLADVDALRAEIAALRERLAVIETRLDEYDRRRFRFPWERRD